MKLLDVATAAVIGLGTIALLAYANPAVYIAAQSQAADEIKVNHALLSTVRSRGLPWFQTAPAGEICASLVTSNQSVSVSAVVDGLPCPSGWTGTGEQNNLTIILPGRIVILEAWPGARR